MWWRDSTSKSKKKHTQGKSVKKIKAWLTHTVGFYININPFSPSTPTKIMWLRLVNGVYCFLPKDSCSSIQPLIHLLIFLACFLCANTFLPLLSGCKVPGRWALLHVWGPGRAHTEWTRASKQMKQRPNDDLNRKLCWQRGSLKRQWEGRKAGCATLSTICSSLVSTVESFTPSHDPCCSRLVSRRAEKMGGKGDPVEKCACGYIIYQLYSSTHPLLSLFLKFYIHVYIYYVYGKISIYNICL